MGGMSEAMSLKLKGPITKHAEEYLRVRDELAPLFRAKVDDGSVSEENFCHFLDIAVLRRMYGKRPNQVNYQQKLLEGRRLG